MLNLHRKDTTKSGPMVQKARKAEEERRPKKTLGMRESREPEGVNRC